MPIRIIKHETVPNCGSFEVKSDGQPSRYFYFEDVPGRQAQKRTNDYGAGPGSRKGVRQKRAGQSTMKYAETVATGLPG
jgi:hypothetical protein